MFGIGPTEIIIIVILAFLVLGPERIPEAASKLGAAIRKFRQVSWEVQNELKIEETLKKPLTDLQSAIYTPVGRAVIDSSLVRSPEQLPQVTDEHAASDALSKPKGEGHV